MDIAQIEATVYSTIVPRISQESMFIGTITQIQARLGVFLDI